MALDGKAIKEEIPDKDVYEATSRRVKDKDQCRSPDSPDGTRAVAPRSPLSPQITQTTSSGRNGAGSTSPGVLNGGSVTPPPAAAPSSLLAAIPTSAQESGRVFVKIRRFLGALVQFGQDSGPDVGDRVRALVLSLASGGLTAEEFKVALQEATNFPLRPYVLPFLKAHMPLLQRELTVLARASNQSVSQFVRSNETSVFEFAHNPTEHSEIFLPIEGGSFGGNGASINGNGLLLKRRASDNFFDSQHQHEWSEHSVPSKRPHHSLMLSGGTTAHLLPAHTPLFDYQLAPHLHADFGGEKPAFARDERSDVRPLDFRGARSDEEWKNIHTMLNCISAMVDKTKRAITILQQRGADSHQSYQEASLAEIKRLTDEKVAEFKRSAEDAVNQVKRQAVIEIQRAVAAAESRAVEIVAQERLKMDKLFAELGKGGAEAPPEETQANVCWKCGRKATETCSGCGLAKYCSAFCQHKDWEQHIKICGTIRLDPKLRTHAQARSSPPQTQSSAANSQPATQSSQPASVANGGASTVK
ncbi:protein CBFA2T1 [Phlebotomus argentipes]|uniref:protein CBFA2T1 n=1 Tax=Phlebotomus argentipes TaxID=94469 RepID=UPI002892B913|nr:protein CBFA2T1 [Phlebotomus argentipes]